MEDCSASPISYSRERDRGPNLASLGHYATI
jgi:hypothetical protein